MNTRFIVAVALRWHLRKARRLFELLRQRLVRPAEPTMQTGVRWG